MLDKLSLLGAAARHDLACACGDSGHRIKNDYSRWIYPAVIPSGGIVRMLKVLFTNECKNNCFYCANRSSADGKRISFTPEELAALFVKLYQKGLVNALFLSSAVKKSADETMMQMLKTVEIIRFRYGFRGFIHLKILPGASYSLIERSVKTATRVSVNLECPNARTLRQIAPDKNFDQDLIGTVQVIQNLIENYQGKKRDQTTQFIVGAADETDKDIIATVWTLYKKYHIARSYYSAYEPPEEKPWGKITPAPLMREHRLYQTDFLLRKYHFMYDEIEFDATGNLSLDDDPKTCWAAKHPDLFPVEITRADKWQLLRVPGIGPVTAQKIVEQRKTAVFRNEEDLIAMGINPVRSLSYLSLKGKAINPPGVSCSKQLSFEL